MRELNIQKIWEKVRARENNLVNHLGIEITHVSEEGLRGSMPVDERTVQPYGILHGGASVVLAETLASFGGAIFVDLSQQFVAGLEINANHVRGAPLGGGRVFGEAKPLHVGRTTQVWGIEIKNEKGQLICLSRCTLAVVDQKK